jgi:hypothetical protein
MQQVLTNHFGNHYMEQLGYMLDILLRDRRGHIWMGMP